MVHQEQHFDNQHTELVINDVDMCLRWVLDMSLGSGGFSINVWDGESFDCNFDLDRKGKADENQHAMLLCIPFKYIFLMQGDTVHAGAMNNHLTNGALRLHSYVCTCCLAVPLPRKTQLKSGNKLGMPLTQRPMERIVSLYL